ncbi:MAG: glycosyltransferase family 2 protein, partial [Planctomycetota bacterium]
MQASLADPTTFTDDQPDDDQKPQLVSVIIPTFNESMSLKTLHAGIVDAFCSLRSEVDGPLPAPHVEIIFVDDGSTDESWNTIEAIAAQPPDDARVSTIGIRLRRNFGKAAALDAGIRTAVGDVVLTMDADLQDDPKEIPRFLAKMEEGFDVVSGWKKVRHDPWHKVGPSRVFNALVSSMTGVKLNDHNCGFKAYRREIFDEVTLYGERHRFVPVLAAARGWSVGEIVVEHHAR